MKSPTPKASPQDLQLYARQWGATAVPFTQLSPEAWIQTQETTRAEQLLDQSVGLRSVMLLDGPNGVGKSVLVGRWVRQLDARLYPVLVITQATMTGSSLLATLTAKLGKTPSCRREANLSRLEEALAELERQTLVVVLDEAQHYAASALEEIRLLLGLNLPDQPTFALILIGDEYLLSTLRLRHHRALFSRLGAYHSLRLWESQQAAQFLEAGFAAVGLSASAIDAAASDLIVRAAGGVPRTLALLARNAWIEASRAQSQIVTAQHVQGALDQIPGAAISAVASAPETMA